MQYLGVSDRGAFYSYSIRIAYKGAVMEFDSPRNLLTLEWLDLSSNKLTGTIPNQLLELTSLSFLNLPRNELIGCIPRRNQFNTFENSSYERNEGLLGFPLTKDCSNSVSPPPLNLLEDKDGSESIIAFGWKVVLMSYRCGLAFGLLMGYIVFQIGKPRWFVSLVEDQHHKRHKAPRIIGCRSGGGRT
ncbi:hypothetical protein DITRI_Ditri01bG0173700 [Diplodiscus trichospermus]